MPVSIGGREMRDAIGGEPVALCFSEDIAGGSLPLLVAERAEFAAVFGADVEFVSRPRDCQPAWVVEVSASVSEPRLEWDADRRRLTSVVRDAAGFTETLQLLHSLVARGAKSLTAVPAGSMAEAVDLVKLEIAAGFPAFTQRGIDWDDVCRAYVADDPATMTVTDLERWIAALGDGHTAIRRAGSIWHPPYAVEMVSGEAFMRRVPEGSAAWGAGVRPESRLVLDAADQWIAESSEAWSPAGWGLVMGRRAIMLRNGASRRFVADDAGERREWEEPFGTYTREWLLCTRVVDRDNIAIRLGNWIEGLGIQERLAGFLKAHEGVSRLILDLRGNTGGSLMMAKRVQRWFLRERTELGSIQFTRGDGTLAAPVEMMAEPSDEVRWPGEVVVLTDGLTYSASEDFLLGLQGLAHVTVIGSPSGGGSGRPRTVRVLPGVNLTISTALTFDRQGRCVEGQGVPVDVDVDPFALSVEDAVRMLG